MSKGLKIAGGIIKIFLGLYGIDCFIVGKIGKGISELLSTIFTIILTGVASVFSFIPFVGIVPAVLVLSLVVRGIINTVKGIIILCTPASAARRLF